MDHRKYRVKTDAYFAPKTVHYRVEACTITRDKRIRKEWFMEVPIMTFAIGDKVRHKKYHPGKIGKVVHVFDDWLEVEIDEISYFWSKKLTELDYDDLLTQFEAMLGNGGWSDYDELPPLPIEFEDNTEIKCTCDSWTLFHFGCKCDAFKKEQEKKRQREQKDETSNRGGDMDRENG
jgi:hypothetical protein